MENEGFSVDTAALEQLEIDLRKAKAKVNAAKDYITSANGMSSIKASTSIEDASTNVGSAEKKVGDIIFEVDEAERKMMCELSGITDDEYNEYSQLALTFSSDEEFIKWMETSDKSEPEKVKAFYVYMIDKGQEERKWLNQELSRWNYYNIPGEGIDPSKKVYGIKDGQYSYTEEQLIQLEVLMLNKYCKDFSVNVDSEFLRNSPSANALLRILGFDDSNPCGNTSATNAFFNDDVSESDKKNCYSTGSYGGLTLWDAENIVLYYIAGPNATPHSYHGVDYNVNLSEDLSKRLDDSKNTDVVEFFLNGGFSGAIPFKYNFNLSRSDLNLDSYLTDILIENRDDPELKQIYEDVFGTDNYDFIEVTRLLVCAGSENLQNIQCNLNNVNSSLYSLIVSSRIFEFEDVMFETDFSEFNFDSPQLTDEYYEYFINGRGKIDYREAFTRGGESFDLYDLKQMRDINGKPVNFLYYYQAINKDSGNYDFLRFGAVDCEMLDRCYTYMTPEEKQIFNYYFNKGDYDGAEGYLLALEDRVNDRAAQKDVLREIMTYKPEDGQVVDFFNSLLYGTGVGWNNHFEGFGDLVDCLTGNSGRGIKSVNEYKASYFTYYAAIALNEDENVLKNAYNGLGDISGFNYDNPDSFNIESALANGTITPQQASQIEEYKLLKEFRKNVYANSGLTVADGFGFGYNFGNMAPAMIASIGLSLAGFPGGAASIIASTEFGLSILGNEAEEGYQSNFENEAAIWGKAGLSASSEVLLGSLLGGMPGLSLAKKTFAMSILMEGIEEWGQEWIDAYLMQAFHGQTINYVQTSENSHEAFVQGMVFSFALSPVGKLVEVCINGKNVKVSSGQLNEAIAKHTSPNGTVDYAAVVEELSIIPYTGDSTTTNSTDGTSTNSKNGMKSETAKTETDTGGSSGKYETLDDLWEAVVNGEVTTKKEVMEILKNSGLEFDVDGSEGVGHLFMADFTKYKRKGEITPNPIWSGKGIELNNQQNVDINNGGLETESSTNADASGTPAEAEAKKSAEEGTGEKTSDVPSETQNAQTGDTESSTSQNESQEQAKNSEGQAGEVLSESLKNATNKTQETMESQKNADSNQSAPPETQNNQTGVTESSTAQNESQEQAKNSEGQAGEVLSESLKNATNKTQETMESQKNADSNQSASQETQNNQTGDTEGSKAQNTSQEQAKNSAGQAGEGLSESLKNATNKQTNNMQNENQQSDILVNDFSNSNLDELIENTKNMTTFEKAEYVQGLVENGIITNKEDLLKFFGGDVGTAKTTFNTLGGSHVYRDIVNGFQTTSNNVNDSITNGFNQETETEILNVKNNEPTDIINQQEENTSIIVEPDKTLTNPQKQNTDLTIPEKQNTDLTISEKQNTDLTISEKQNTDLTIPEKQNTDLTIPEKQNTDLTIKEKIDQEVEPVIEPIVDPVKKNKTSIWWWLIPIVILPFTTLFNLGKDEFYLNLKGDSEIELFINNKYVEPGWEAYDSVDGNLNDKVVQPVVVDSSKLGVYTLTYTVTNSRNKTLTKTRKVTIIPKKTLVDGEVIEITLDDFNSQIEKGKVYDGIRVNTTQLMNEYINKFLLQKSMIYAVSITSIVLDDNRYSDVLACNSNYLKTEASATIVTNGTIERIYNNSNNCFENYGVFYFTKNKLHHTLIRNDNDNNAIINSKTRNTFIYQDIIVDNNAVVNDSQTLTKNNALCQSGPNTLKLFNFDKEISYSELGRRMIDNGCQTGVLLTDGDTILYKSQYSSTLNIQTGTNNLTDSIIFFYQKN